MQTVFMFCQQVPYLYWRRSKHYKRSVCRLSAFLKRKRLFKKILLRLAQSCMCFWVQLTMPPGFPNVFITKTDTYEISALCFVTCCPKEAHLCGLFVLKAIGVGGEMATWLHRLNKLNEGAATVKSSYRWATNRQEQEGEWFWCSLILWTWPKDVHSVDVQRWRWRIR